MTSENFRDLVRRMRSAQNEYFKTRSRLALGTAKVFEKQVDLELASEPLAWIIHEESTKSRKESLKRNRIRLSKI